MLLVDGILQEFGTFLQGVAGGFQAEGGQEESSIRFTELDGTQPHLDDEAALVILADLELVVSQVEDMVDGLGDEGSFRLAEELGRLFLVPEDDDPVLTRDGVDTQVLGEYHPGVGVLGDFLGGEGDGGDGERNRKDDVFHICWELLHLLILFLCS